MDKIAKNAQVVVELARLFPNDPLGAIVGVLDMPVIDKNNAVWYAMDRGLVEQSEDKTKPLVLLTDSKPLELPEISEIYSAIMHCMGRLAEKEQDIAEGTLNTWLQGYPTHFSAIAIKQLLENGDLMAYTIFDQVMKKKGVEEYPYLFYTLPENFDKQWGKKMFKNVNKTRIKNTKDDGITRH